ncbi:MAG: hypothetical protein KIS85_08845 [Anaerolineales bacterium]|nr:hypothetical protein [Anaerolineales bacterium]
MISRELLYAILQGLPHKYFGVLEPPWLGMAWRIQGHLLGGDDPVTALKGAYANLGPGARKQLRETLQQVLPIMGLAGLSYRQRETLLALRSLKVASLSQVCAVLTHDRRNTHRRLNALVDKGYAIRLYQPNGVHYMAIEAPMERSVKQAINEFIQELIEQSMAPEEPQIEQDFTDSQTPAESLMVPPTGPARPGSATPKYTIDTGYTGDIFAPSDRFNTKSTAPSLQF